MRRAIASRTSRPTRSRTSRATTRCRRSARSSCRCNYRLTADDFAYLIAHSGSKVVCAHPDQMDAVDRIRDQLPASTQFVALEGAARRLAGLRSSSLAARVRALLSARRSSERDLLSINYTSGTTSRPKGVMITHRNAYMNVVGTLIHAADARRRPLPVDAADVPRQRLDVHVDRDRGRRHARVPAQGRSVGRSSADSRRAHHDAVRGADGAHRAGATPTRVAARGAPRGVRVITAGAPPAAATIRAVEEELGWTVTQVYGLTETAPFITVCEPRPRTRGARRRRARAHQGAPGRRADHVRRAARRRRRRATRCRATAKRSARSSRAATS